MRRTSGSSTMISTQPPWRSRVKGTLQGFALIALMTMVGCSPLEPLAEPEVADLQLTVDTLKTTIREGQRTIADLRQELEAQRQELADVQIARAQLDGRVREAERRLVEARQIIDLQREELAGSRSERNRVTRSGAALQHELKQLQQQLARLSGQTNQARGARVAPASRADMHDSLTSIPGIHEPSERLVSQAVHVSKETGQATAPPKASGRVLVKPGDTLWSIAQRYRVSVKRLMAINQLPDTHIEAGQFLSLSDLAISQDGDLGSMQ